MAYRITYFIQFSLLGVGLAASTGHLARLVPETHEEGEEEEEEEEEEGGVTIDLEQRRLDFNGEIDANFLFFQKTKFRLGYADYEHDELKWVRKEDLLRYEMPPADRPLAAQLRDFL